MNFYISDTHFGHANIIRLCNRPFQDVDRMDNTLINNWNNTVSNKDTIYILGDFAFKSKSPIEYLKKLNGKKILILGNHDSDIRKHPENYSKYLDGIHNYLEISDTIGKETYRVVLFHYPIAEWNGFFRNNIHLYGHVHNNKKNDSYFIMKNIKNAYNVGADILDFTPRTLKDIMAFNKEFFK